MRPHLTSKTAPPYFHYLTTSRFWSIERVIAVASLLGVDITALEDFEKRDGRRVGVRQRALVEYPDGRRVILDPAKPKEAQQLMKEWGELFGFKPEPVARVVHCFCCIAWNGVQ